MLAAYDHGRGRHRHRLPAAGGFVARAQDAQRARRDRHYADGAKSAILGTIDLAFTTQTSLAERTVTLTDARLVAAHFPSTTPDRAAQIEQRIRVAVANLGVKQVPLAAVVMSLRQQTEKPPEIALNNTPPRIFASTRAASLVVFDGEPILAPIAGTSLSYAVNTNWDVFNDASTKTGTC
jgi:hypothetical protein